MCEKRLNIGILEMLVCRIIGMVFNLLCLHKPSANRYKDVVFFEEVHISCEQWSSFIPFINTEGKFKWSKDINLQCTKCYASWKMMDVMNSIIFTNSLDCSSQINWKSLFHFNKMQTSLGVAETQLKYFIKFIFCCKINKNSKSHSKLYGEVSILACITLGEWSCHSLSSFETALCKNMSSLCGSSVVAYHGSWYQQYTFRKKVRKLIKQQQYQQHVLRVLLIFVQAVRVN